MQNIKYIVFICLCASIIAQDQNKQTKRKVYRTQTGSIIEAPTPLFERPKKNASSEKRVKKRTKPKVLARTEKIESTYRNELDSLKRTVKQLLNQSKMLQENYENKLAEKQTDTIFVYTTLYDTTTVLDT